jgi:sulfatase maturation enzyme AslB (radical SAM superfamily)
MDSVPIKAFTLQTNGILLDQVDSNYLNWLDTILVSIDGERDVTDANRGIGIYDKVIKKYIVNQGKRVQR